MTRTDHDSNVLAAIVPLREAGFALHWLKPRSKAPAGGDDWQEAPVATLAELQRTHFAGANVGVRPGEYSRVGDLYLHIIDADIRIPDLADEAWESFANLFPGLRETLPSVISGSGGESRHYYFLTDKPFFGKKLAVSEGKHRRFDKTKGGDVWSYDWEIDLFGTGRQIALPPSIHPDTGLPYAWEREFDFDGFDLPTISSAHIESLGVAETAEYAFESRPPLDFKPGQLESDLDALPVERWDDRAEWIMIGQALHHQFGGSDEGFELWARFSAKSSKCDKDFRRANLRRYRTFGRNRRQPVTMGTIRQWAQDARSAALADEFDDLDDPVDDEDDDDSFDELLAAPAAANDDDWDGGTLTEDEKALPWTSLLAVNEEGEIKANLHNLRLIVENDVWTRGVTAFNEFTQEVVQRGKPGIKNARRKNAAKPVLQLEGASWQLRDAANGDFWTEDKDNAIRALIEAPKTQGGYGIKVPDRDLRAAIDIVGRKNCFHPVREYLAKQTWDGKPRVERLFVDYLGAPDDAYTRNVGRLMMIAAVTRVFEPGHKFDFAVILQGLQGKRKSTFISVLAKSWFAELEGDIEDPRQMVETMQGSWILEIGELGGLVRADVRHIKAFISRRSDKVRLAYAKRAQEYHRQCIFIGSTNDDKYLKDDTGGRRFWPIACSVDEIDTDRLADEIDQMWAEARVLYERMRKQQPKGTLPLYLADEEARTIAARLQESARVESADDAVAGQIAAWLDAPIISGSVDEDLDETGQPRYRNETCLIELWVDCLGKDRGAYNQQTAQMLGRAMSKLTDWRADGRFVTFQKWGRQRVYDRGGSIGRLDRMGPEKTF